MHVGYSLFVDKSEERNKRELEYKEEEVMLVAVVRERKRGYYTKKYETLRERKRKSWG